MKRFSITGTCAGSFVRTMCMALCLASVVAAAENPAQTDRGRRASTRLAPIQLPQPATSSAVSFEQAVLELAKLRPPSDQRLDQAKISQLAWASQAMMSPMLTGTPAAAQAVSEPPMRAFFVLPEGLFAYEPAGHTLQPIAGSDVRAPLASALIKQTVVPIGGCQIIVAASTRDFTAQYAGKARTIMALLAGRVSQTIQLQAVAQGLTFVGLDGVDGGDVRRVARIPRNYDPLYVAIIGYPVNEAPNTAVQPPQQAAAQRTGHRALLIVPPMGFQDEEFAATRRALETAGVQVSVASTRMGPLAGMAGTTTQANLLLNQVNIDDFDAVVFVGGIGARDYVGNAIAQNLARQAAVRRKVLAAIGTAPSILANAGVLRGVRVTAYLTEQQRIVRAGGVYTGNPAEKDGLIITATGPLAVSLFAQAILEGLGQAG
ncbi:MAG: DJ-1/PfpI family protein [Solirubrobacterales bacterium]